MADMSLPVEVDDTLIRSAEGYWVGSKSGAVAVKST